MRTGRSVEWAWRSPHLRRYSTTLACILSLALVGCDPGSTSAQNGDAASTGRCKETIAQGCDAGNLLFFGGRGQDPCTTRPDQFAIKFERFFYPVACDLEYCGSKYIVVHLRRSQTDTDRWDYIFDAKTGALLEGEVIPWMGDGPYCLAGMDTLPAESCTRGPSCNTGCAVTPSDCLPRTSVFDPIETQICGPPTTMTGCDGSTTTFEGCSCSGATWSCTTADAGTVKIPSCDAGAD